MTVSFRSRSSIAIVFCLALIASGCGRDDKDKADKTTDSGSTETTEEAKAFIDPATDCKGTYQATQGITGDTIKLGTFRPGPGPYSLYNTVTLGVQKYFEAANAKGGLPAGDGKKYKIDLVVTEDGYDPSKTPGVVKKMVEEDKVFGLVGNIGTEGNLAVRDYLNEQCVPNVALATGSAEWNKAASYPWYSPGLPAYALEVKSFLDYVSKTKPDATIAVLKQNDDFGEGYDSAIKKYLTDNKSKMKVVGDEVYDVSSGGTTEGATAKLAATKADVFFVGIGGTQCPTTLKFRPADWTPMTYLSIPCSVKLALTLAGSSAEGVFTSQATLDPGDPADQKDPKTQEFFTDGRSVGVSDSDLQNGIVAAGWGFAADFAAILSQTKDLTRAGFMDTAFSIRSANYGLMRNEAKAETKGADDPWLLEALRVVQRSGDTWTEVAPVTDHNGESNGLAGK